MNLVSSRTRLGVEAVFSLSLVYGLIGFVTGGLRLFYPTGAPLITGLSWKLSLAASGVLGLLLLWLDRQYGFRGTNRIDTAERLSVVALVGYALILISDYFTRQFAFFPSTAIRGELVVVGIIGFGIFLTLRRRSSDAEKSSLYFSVLLLLQLLIATIFLRHAEGRLLIGDDHPNFLYRLQLLREHFPFIPFYNTDWNAGYSAHEFFPSGVLNVFLLTAPLLYWLIDLGTLEGAASYNFLIAYLYVFIVPWSVYAASRLLGVSRGGATIAAVLALGPSLGFFEWLLKYGTIGFALSAGIAPLTFALCLRLAVSDESPSWRHVFLLLFVSFCCLTWTLSAVVFLPVIVIAIIRMFRLREHERRVKIAVFAFLFVLINAPWVVTFATVSKVGSFVQGNVLPGTAKKVVAPGVEAKPSVTSRITTLAKSAHKDLKASLVKANPLLLLLFIPGCFFLRSRWVSLATLVTILWLIGIAGVGDVLKPQLELGRMVLVACFLMCPVAGAASTKLFESFRDQFDLRLRLLRRIAVTAGVVILTGSLIVSPLTVAAAYVNRTDERFTLATAEVEELSRALLEYSSDGRLFFMGFILHELGARNYQSQDGGHIAILAMFSGQSMYASDYYHRRWTHIDPIPSSFRRRGKEGIEEFLNLVNATSVVTFKQEWANYCLNTAAEHYEQIFKVGRFRLFLRKYTSNYFLEGDGTIELAKEGFYVTPKTEEVILKFRYLRGLKTSGHENSVIEPVFVFDEDAGKNQTERVEFIKLRVPASAVANKSKIKIGFWN